MQGLYSGLNNAVCESVSLHNSIGAGAIPLIRPADRISYGIRVKLGIHTMYECLKKFNGWFPIIRAYAVDRRDALLFKLRGLFQLPSLLSNNGCEGVIQEPIRRMVLKLDNRTLLCQIVSKFKEQIFCLNLRQKKSIKLKISILPPPKGEKR